MRKMPCIVTENIKNINAVEVFVILLLFFLNRDVEETPGGDIMSQKTSSSVTAHVAGQR